MAEQWLIDGYNVFHSLRSNSSRKPPLQREQFFALLAEFASLKKIHTLLVLDGVGAQSEMDGYRTDHFEIVFSQKTSADACIEKYLFQHRQTQDLVVVTDDRAVANIGRGGGARVISTSLFADMLKDCKKEASEDLDRR